MDKLEQGTGKKAKNGKDKTSMDDNNLSPGGATFHSLG